MGAIEWSHPTEWDGAPLGIDDVIRPGAPFMLCAYLDEKEGRHLHLVPGMDWLTHILGNQGEDCPCSAEHVQYTDPTTSVESAVWLHFPANLSYYIHPERYVMEGGKRRE